MWWIVLMSIVVYGGAELQNSRMTRSYNKIYGGRETTIEKYPYATQLMYRVDPFIELQFVCGGSVITMWHVLTAAHCLVKDEDEKYGTDLPLTEFCPSNIFARVGSNTLYTGGSVHQGSAIVVHPKYASKGKDIAVLMLITPVTFSSKVQPAIIPPQGQFAPENALVKIIGWGQTSPTNLESKVLLEATIRLVSFKDCKRRYKENSEYTWDSGIFCAGLLDIGVINTCYGDSGGPVVLGEVVIGLTSLGAADECDDPNFPDVYTNISAYTNWINGVVLATTNNSPHSSLTIRVVLIYILSTAYLVSH